jgi:hypothetical protein
MLNSIPLIKKGVVYVFNIQIDPQSFNCSKLLKYHIILSKQDQLSQDNCFDITRCPN